MYWKEREFLRNEPLSFGATDKWELPDCGKLSAIKLVFKATNERDLLASAGERITDHITALRVTTGGGDVVYNLPGQLNKSDFWYNESVLAPEMFVSVGGNVQQTTVIIPFGQFIKDKAYGLDLDVFCQLYLEISNDITNAIFVDDSVLVDIMLIEMMDVVRPWTEYIKRFLYRAERPKAVGAQVVQEMPSGAPIMRIMCQLDPDLTLAGFPEHDPKTIGNKIALKFQGDAVTVLDLEVMHLMRDNATEYGKPDVRGRTKFHSVDGNDLKLAVIESMTQCAVPVPGSIVAGMQQEDNWGRYQKIDATVENLLYIEWDAVGWGLYHTVVLFEAMREFGSDPITPVCGADRCNPVRIIWSPTYKDNTLKTVISQAVRQGKTSGG